MVDRRKVWAYQRQANYGRGQGLVVGLFSFVVFLGVFGGLIAADPMGFVSAKEHTFRLAENWVVDLTETKVHFYVLYLYLMFSGWVWVAAFAGLWFAASRAAEKQLARNIIIYGEEATFDPYKGVVVDETEEQK